MPGTLVHSPLCNLKWSLPALCCRAFGICSYEIDQAGCSQQTFPATVDQDDNSWIYFDDTFNLGTRMALAMDMTFNFLAANAFLRSCGNACETGM